MDMKVPLSLPNDPLKHVVFLDRDGVVNRDSPNYIKSLSEFEFLPRSLAGLQMLAANQFRAILVTNQSAVNRGLITEKTLTAIHASMQAEIRAHGGEMNDIYFCPHTPIEGCECRKPAPGMILGAQKEHRIDLAAACMVGDSAKDIECARRAGVGRALLVKTGNFDKAMHDLTAKGIRPDVIVADLYDAAEWIIKDRSQKTERNR